MSELKWVCGLDACPRVSLMRNLIFVVLPVGTANDRRMCISEWCNWHISWWRPWRLAVKTFGNWGSHCHCCWNLSVRFSTALLWLRGHFKSFLSFEFCAVRHRFELLCQSMLYYIVVKSFLESQIWRTFTAVFLREAFHRNAHCQPFFEPNSIFFRNARALYSEYTVTLKSRWWCWKLSGGLTCRSHWLWIVLFVENRYKKDLFVLLASHFAVQVYTKLEDITDNITASSILGSVSIKARTVKRVCN